MSARLLTGNAAAAWGARLANVDYVPAFPITPQTEIIETISGWTDSGWAGIATFDLLAPDSTDELLEKRIIKLLPKKRQTLFFSATMPDDIRELSRSILHNPRRVQIGAIAPAETVSHAIYPITHGLKKPLLLTMLKQKAMGRVLIFTRTKRRARFLANDLENLKYRVSALQGNMSQNKRQRAIDGFRNGKYDILVATDIAARGIDVTEISHVINYDMPDTVDAYTHRIGRTGRAHKNGEAFTFALPTDAPMVRDIEKVLKSSIERREFPGFDYIGFQPKNQFKGGASGRAQPAQTQFKGKSRHSRSQKHRSYSVKG